MVSIEKYFGIRNSKKLVSKKLHQRSNKYLAKLEEACLLKEANELFVKGNTNQCFGLLQKAVVLAPNDFRVYYLLALIHEERQNYEKSLMAYTAAAVLKKNDVSLWKKMLDIALQTNRQRDQIQALERIFRKEPSEAILIKKLEILKEMRKKYAIIACQIQLFTYHGINMKIFDRFEHTNHIGSLKKICASLCECIKLNKEARNELFLRKTIFTLYKTRDWKRILRILDGYYFKNENKIHPDVRFIYFTASLYAKECRLDGLLNFKKLIEDAYVWGEMENIEYAYDLVDCLKKCKEPQKAISLLNKLSTVSQSVRPLHMLGDIYQEMGNILEALYNFNQVLALDSVDQLAKTKLYKLYDILGYNQLAEEFETPAKVVEYIKTAESSKKSEFRYSTGKCQEIRKIFMNCFSVDPFDFSKFLVFSEPLLEDFFNNPFAVVKNRNFKTFLNKNERAPLENFNSLVIYNEGASKKQVSDTLIRISSLHGLDVDEWFLVVRSAITSLIAVERYEEAIEMVRKCFDVNIFRTDGRMMQILFLGIRLYLMSEDYEGILEIIKEMIKGYGYSSMHLLYFLSYFFPDFHYNRTFGLLQKNLQRIIRRNAKDKDDPLSGSEDEEISSIWKDVTISPYLGILSFTPRFLQTETVDFINHNINFKKTEITILKATILISHTKSRTFIDKKNFATQGIACLRSIEADPVGLYNLAKGYHYFGYYLHAEALYLEVIDRGPEDLRRMSVFNLSLIFQENKSKKVLESLLEKYR